MKNLLVSRIELIKSYNVKDIAALVDKYGQAAVDESIGLLRVEDFIIDNATVEEKVTPVTHKVWTEMIRL